MVILHNKLRAVFPAVMLLLVVCMTSQCRAQAQTSTLQTHAQAKNSCLDCHSILPDELGVTEEKFSHDIHSQKGLTCVSCHGGDANADEAEKAMSTKAGFKGKIDRKQVPQLCGSCHSDPAYMRQFNPGLRTDQLSQYKTSVHGTRLA